MLYPRESWYLRSSYTAASAARGGDCGRERGRRMRQRQRGGVHEGRQRLPQGRQQVLSARGVGILPLSLSTALRAPVSSLSFLRAWNSWAEGTPAAAWQSDASRTIMLLCWETNLRLWSTYESCHRRCAARRRRVCAGREAAR